MDLSIIIPVYNTDISKLKNCLDSIIKIDKLSYEILVIDDGSNKDNSNSYKELIKNIPNTKYIYQKNSGVSFARNTGIFNSKGKYIMFVDSDDSIKAEVLDFKFFNKNDDIIIFDFIYFYEKKQIVGKEFEQKDGYINYLEVMKKNISENKFHTPWAKLIKKSFLIDNNIKFNTDFIQGEDALFNLCMLSKAPKVYYTNNILYIYNVSFSIAKNRNTSLLDIAYKNFEHLYINKKELIQKYFSKDEKYLINKLNKNYFNSAFSYYLSICNNDSKYSIEIKKSIRNFVNGLHIDELTLIMKIKKYLIKNEKERLMYMLIKIRNVYLKHFKRKI